VSEEAQVGGEYSLSGNIRFRFLSFPLLAAFVVEKWRTEWKKGLKNRPVWFSGGGSVWLLDKHREQPT
jgi:hypothetical protein